MNDGKATPRGQGSRKHRLPKLPFTGNLSIIDRYIARQFLATFLFALASFAALFIIINLVENLDRFMDKQVPLGTVIIYYLSGLPDTFLLTSPLSALLASLFVTGKLSMQSELAALKSAGMSLSRLMKPFLIATLLITAANLVNSCFIDPALYNWSKGYERRFLNRQQNNHEGPLHIRESSNRILTVGQIAPDRISATAISFETFSQSRLVSRIDADSLRMLPLNNVWVFYNTKKRTFANGVENLVVNTGSDTLKLSLAPNTFRMIDTDPDEMNIMQHYDFIRQKERSGLPELEKATVKLHTKIALPLASMIIVLIGVPLSSKKKRSGLAVEISISLFIGLLYLGMLRTIGSLGYDGLLNPVLAAWLPDLLFITAGALLYRSANH
ncbi:YjgP/YjgQ family permease [Chlorobaculum sp. 24CR]|uniref:LptF/LptG family permease n=1 Tax=Chlorobaculum sp. 24CR TaxID=2508878 RepID=UPI00100BA876|nr:LptF/LptG family permease [Chlorobaculum sp. 24CR]RXK84573.1 YjgP/YjgQ family permease [Chlorobaculum sp. 24CR]